MATDLSVTCPECGQVHCLSRLTPIIEQDEPVEAGLVTFYDPPRCTGWILPCCELPGTQLHMDLANAVARLERRSSGD